MVDLFLCSTALAQSGDPPAQETLVLTDELDQYPLGLHLEILEDPSGELTIEDVSSPEFDSQFKPSQEAVPNFGYSESSYWVRFQLKNNTSGVNQWLLEVAFANVHFIDLYIPYPDAEGFAVKQTGINRPPATRDIRYPHFVFDLSAPVQSQQTAYLNIRSGASIVLPFTLWTPDAFINESQWSQVLQVLIFGALVGLLVYNLFILFSLREIVYLYLVILIASWLVFDLAYAGYMEIYIIPNLYYLRQFYMAVSFALVFVSMVLYTALVIGLARGISVIMTNGLIRDTILYWAESAVSGLGGVAFINLINLLYLPLGFLIPSSSGLATVSMPIMAPLADTAGVDRSLVVTAYQSASGLLNLVNPTFAVVMGGLALGRVRFDKWLCFTLPVLVILFVLSAVVLSIGVFFPDSVFF